MTATARLRYARLAARGRHTSGVNMMKWQWLCLLALATCGCVSTEVLAPKGPAAELAMDIESHSTGGGLGRHWNVWKYEDSACRDPEKGVRVAHKRKGKPMESLHLPAEQPITLALWYIEANYGNNRECSYTWTFTPKTGEHYRARLAVSRDIHCNVTLVDAAGAPVDVSTPENSCVLGVYGKRIPNGEPAIITYEVRVVPY